MDKIEIGRCPITRNLCSSGCEWADNETGLCAISLIAHELERIADCLSEREGYYGR